MEVATSTIEANLSAIHESLAKLTEKLGRIAARQESMLVDLKKTTAMLAPTATTMPLYVTGRVQEQQATKISSPSVILVNRAMSATALHSDAILTSCMPTGCSTIGSAVNKGSNHAAVVFPTSGTMHLHATTLTSDGNNTLQGMVGSGVNTPAGCSNRVLFCPPNDLCARTMEANNDIPAEGSVWVEGTPDEVLTHIGGLSLFQESGICKSSEKLKLTWPPSFQLNSTSNQLDLGYAPLPSFWCDPLLGKHWEHLLEGRQSISVKKFGTESACCIFDKVSPWRRNSFSPGNNEQHGMVDVFHYDDIPLYVLNFLARIIHAQLFAQWDPGKQVGCWLMLSQYFKEYLQSILGREVCATTSDNNHLLDVTTLSKVSGQHGFCQSDSMVDFKADAKQFGVYNIFWTKDATTEHWDPGILRFICPATLQHLILVFSYRAYGVSVEDGLIGDLEMKRYIHVEENMPIILFDVHTMASLVWLSQAQQLLYMCCGFFYWRQVTCKLQFKQWDPGVF